jgi:glycosyltransferase involved in cell wall biosynthesis
MKIEKEKKIPLVSIGMPVYNGEKYIRDAIDSILAQSFRNFELIISDNFSTDSTQKICETYLKKDTRIKYIKQPKNLGASSNFKFVLKKAVGEFFMWAAHDDFWDKNWLEYLIAIMKPDDLGVRGLAVTVCKDGSVVRVTNTRSFIKGEVVKAFLDDEKNQKAFYWYALFNKKKLEKINLHLLKDDMFGGDSAFIPYFVEFGNLQTINNTSQYYREHADSLSKTGYKSWFKYKNIEHHFFPLRYYALSYKFVSNKYKPFIILNMPIKYFVHQKILLMRLLKLIQSVIQKFYS